jgi:hypothetical protein
MAHLSSKDIMIPSRDMALSSKASLVPQVVLVVPQMASAALDQPLLEVLAAHSLVTS